MSILVHQNETGQKYVCCALRCPNSDGPQAFPGVASGTLNIIYGSQAFFGMCSGPLALISIGYDPQHTQLSSALEGLSYHGEGHVVELRVAEVHVRISPVGDGSELGASSTLQRHAAVNLV